MSCCNGADRGSGFALPERVQTSERSFFTREFENDARKQEFVDQEQT